jgi:coenzyme PQQ precursor peptide PqqA
MDWQTPSFEEIDMSAEIGAYSPDMITDEQTQRVETAEPSELEQS